MTKTTFHLVANIENVTLVVFYTDAQVKAVSGNKCWWCGIWGTQNLLLSRGGGEGGAGVD